MPNRTDSQSSAVARAAQRAVRTRVKVVVNIGRVELEMLRNKPAIRTIEPLARFQASSTLLPQTVLRQDCPDYLAARCTGCKLQPAGDGSCTPSVISGQLISCEPILRAFIGSHQALISLQPLHCSWGGICMLMQVSDLWVSYQALDGGRSSVQLSLPHVLGVDARPGVLPEHSLVISAGAPPPFVPPFTRCIQHEK